MQKKNNSLTCWVITEGMAGTENQCVGIAEALGISPKIIKLTLKEPWATLTPWLGFEQSWTFDPALSGPWPDLLLTSGRKAISAARYIKKKSGGKTFVLHTQDPRSSLKPFDIVAVPYHDPSRGENVYVTDAAPNRITPEKLSEAKEQFSTLKKLPAPRIAVLIGGSSQAYTMSYDITQQLIKRLNKLREQGFSLMITASRRTGDENMRLLKEAFADDEGADFYLGDGENPYFGYLSYADYVLVTADSVSMISDALTTGMPTYIIPLEGGGARISKFHNHLVEKGLARWFEGDLEAYSYEPVYVSQELADEIRNKMPVLSE